jgi:hypothetical protein
MLRKPLAIAAAGLALAAPSAALAAHGPGEQAPRLPRHVESLSAYAQAPIVVTAATQGFNWLDAGIGASFTGGCVLALVGAQRLRHLRRRRIWLDHIS